MNVREIGRMVERLPLLALPRFRRHAMSLLERRARLTLPLRIRRRLAAGSARACTVCDSSVAGFRPLGSTVEAWCPVCGSMPWHRLAWLFYRRCTGLFDDTPTRMLHVAPEEEFAARLARMPSIDYLPVDLDTRAPMVKERMDVTAIDYPSDSFDVIVCNHVLEHIPDDRRAMREFHRVLRPGGWAALIVPLQAEPTVEDPSCIDPAERERRFGQFDHVRIYGPDFAERLRDAGFDVSAVRAAALVPDADERRRLGLGGLPLFHCRKPALDRATPGTPAVQ